MQTQSRVRTPWLVSTSVCLMFVITVLVGISDSGFTTPAPILGPLVVSNGYFRVVITNGEPAAYYEIELRDSLDPLYTWRWAATGVQGQTNFQVPLGQSSTAFLRALSCTDCDDDGIPNTADANPLDATIRALSVTIVSPANGSTIQ
jgi:hypothetical protein